MSIADKGPPPLAKRRAGPLVATLTSLHILHVEVQVVRDLGDKHGLVAGGTLLLLQHGHHLLRRLLLVVCPDLQTGGGDKEGNSQGALGDS